MTLAQIRESAKTRIPDTTFWTDAKLTQMVNDAVLDVLKFFNISRVKSITTFSTVASQKRYPLPWDWIETHFMHYNSGHDTIITMLDDPEMIYERVSDVDQEGLPTHAYMWGVNSRVEFFLYPVPNDVYEIEHYFWSLGATLVDDDDIPMIEKPHHQSLVDYLIRKTRAEDDDNLIADSNFDGWWEIQKISMRVSNNRRTNERREMRPANGQKMFGYGSDERPPFRLTSDTVRW